MHDHGKSVQLPVSSGFPVFVRVCGWVGLIVIFIMGGMVVANSGGNHVWPANDSVRVPLDSAK
ncbi:MAG TPA: hypothetical protein VGG22_10700 [Candidatus Baltobacteraceae bacterium]|jgi:hypothetical protein